MGIHSFGDLVETNHWANYLCARRTNTGYTVGGQAGEERTLFPGSQGMAWVGMIDLFVPKQQNWANRQCQVKNCLMATNKHMQWISDHPTLRADGVTL